MPGTDPLLKLMAVDWITSEEKVDFVAKNPKSIVQVNNLRHLKHIIMLVLR